MAGPGQLRGPDDGGAGDRPVCPGAIEHGTALALLGEGELEVVGRLVASSNRALYCSITRRCPDPDPDVVAACVYKPIRGELLLDGFPDGTLGFREVASHVDSEAS